MSRSPSTASTRKGKRSAHLKRVRLAAEEHQESSPTVSRKPTEEEMLRYTTTRYTGWSTRNIV